MNGTRGKVAVAVLAVALVGGTGFGAATAALAHSSNASSVSPAKIAFGQQYSQKAAAAARANPSPPNQNAKLPTAPRKSCPTQPINTAIEPPYGSAPIDQAPTPTTELVMTVDGQVYGVAAGASADSQAEGVIRVATYPMDLCKDPETQMTAKDYPDPRSGGKLTLLSRTGPVLTFSRADGSDGTFDMSTMTFGS